MTRAALTVVALLAFASFGAMAQRAVATGGVNVREARTSASTALTHLDEGDTVALVASHPLQGYFHVRTDDGVTGWAWAARLDVIDTAPAAASATAGAISDTWAKTPTNAEDYHWADGNHAECDAGGSGKAGHFDPETNVWKNRTDSAASYHEVSFDAMRALPVPQNSTRYRANWSPSDKSVLAEYEGIPIALVGYLAGVKAEVPPKDPATGERKHGESTNCGESADTRIDWHMYVTDVPHGRHALSVVVETTPRVRPMHPGWTLDKLRHATQQGDSVRISGWLMFDPEHYDQMWQYRSPSDTTGIKARITLWEVHPITRIELRRGGAWALLDTLP